MRDSENWVFQELNEKYVDNFLVCFSFFNFWDLLPLQMNAKRFWGLEKKGEMNQEYVRTFALSFIQKYFVYFNLEQVKTFESKSNF